MNVRRAAVAAVAALLALTACATDDQNAATSPEPTDTSDAAVFDAASPLPTAVDDLVDRPVRIDVAQSGGVVTPPPSRVEVPLGSAVVLRVGSDVSDQIHVHGYELEQDVPAGGTTTFEFTADQSGLFEVETHETGLLLLQLQVA